VKLYIDFEAGRLSGTGFSVFVFEFENVDLKIKNEQAEACSTQS
jgi:hypothetical protein